MNDGRIHLSAGTEDTARRTPLESVFFAYAGVAPVVVGAAAFFWLRGEAGALIVRLTIVWAGAILCFLAGVRRGLSFRQDGGPLLTQLATMLGLFTLGFVALVIPWTRMALILEIVGFATMAIYDPVAARKEEAPAYFQRLRPIQMILPTVSLGLILAGLTW